VNHYDRDSFAQGFRLGAAIATLWCLAIFCLFGCASTPAELAARDAELHRRLEPWRYNAVDPRGTIICLAGDRVCHELLERSFLMRGHVGQIGADDK
jgi:hypothetical protein